MRHSFSLDDIRLQNAWLTIGIFDGVHRGHQEILHPLVAEAHSNGDPAVVVTFTPHPAIVLGGKTDFKCLTLTGERAALLGSFGVDEVITQTFDRSLADQTVEEFMQRLSQNLGLSHLFIGYDTAFGRGRAGDAKRLEDIGSSLGYSVRIIPPLKNEGGIISSTRIRSAVGAGNVTAATNDLGRYYSITGPVVHGDGRGHIMNFPTANIQMPAGKVEPAFGIYVTRAWVNQKMFPAATSIGVRPTFYKDEVPTPTIEAHLLDFDRDLYGQEITLEFVEYLRPEEKFPSSQTLMVQIKKDIERTRLKLAEKN